MGESTGPPALSLVVTAYQVERYLPACLDSLLAEASDAVEVIVVNDASPDRCPEIIEDYQRHDDRVRAIHLPANVGAGQARNFGLDSATGEYVWFVDGDDWLPAGSIAALLRRLAETDPDVLIVDHAEEDADTGKVRASRPAGLLATVPGPVSLAAYPELLRLAQSACTKIARRSLLEDAKLRFAPGWYEDSTFSHTLLLAADRIDVLDRVCYWYRQWDRGITRSTSHRHFDVFDQYQQLFDYLDQHADAQAYRSDLFRLMIDHYLVIVGHHRRVPPARRREFFARIHADFHARMPERGYAQPAGLLRFKYSLVRRNAYWTYAAMRYLYRLSPLMRLVRA